MRRVLILAYYFPPMGMGGTQRIAKFVKFLPKFGWQPTVVTVKQTAYYAFDADASRDVRSAQIVRTGSLDPQRLLAIFARLVIKQKGSGLTNIGNSDSTSLWHFINSKIMPLLLVPDSKILWLPYAIAAAQRILQHQRFDAILTTSPPHSIHLAGIFLKKRFSIPLVADFRDRWVGGEFQAEASRIHRGINAGLQAKVLAHAEKVIGVSAGLVAALQQSDPTANEKYVTITNGFDAEDFKSANSAARQKFTFCHCGTVSKISNPEHFLHGLYEALSRRSDIRKQIRIEFVGHVLYQGFQRTISALGLEDVISVLGYKTHNQAIHHLLSADGLLLTISENVSSGFIPGKLFEYLGAKKPVLAIIPRGETAFILKKSGLGYVVWPPDSTTISKAMIKFIDYDFRPQINDKFVQSFERQHLTESLARVLDSLVSEAKKTKY